MSALSRPRDGRPLAVSSIFTARTGPAGGLPIPVSGLTGGGAAGLVGVGVGVGVGVAEAELVVGAGLAGAAVSVSVPLPRSTRAETPPITTTAATPPAIRAWV